jgi:1,2-diacylglycerol 3-alpha-glucosyltransferase
MKVAQVCFRYYPSLGGVQTHVKKLSESLARKGIEVEVLTTDPTKLLPEKETINNVPVRRFKSWAPMGDFHFSGDLASFLKAHYSDYDVVHAHSYNDFPALYAARAKVSNSEGRNGPPPPPFVFTPHYHGRGSNFITNVLHKFYKPFGSKIFSRADIVVCVSKFEKEIVEHNFPNAMGKTLIIPNGVEYIAQNEENSDRQHPEVHLKLPDAYILYVGRIEPYKHVDRIVAALKYVSRNDISLILVGNGPSKDKILKQAHSLDINNRIAFYENLSDSDLAEIYQRAGVLVNLSDLEAFGLNVAEALSRGTPCVVAKSSALIEWVDGVNCLGVDDPGDPQLVARTIDSVLGRRASGVKKLLSWDEIAELLIQNYQEKTGQ